MEKNIVVTMTVEEAKRFENDCEKLKTVFHKYAEKLSESEPNSLALMSLSIHMEKLEKITQIFSTK